MAMADANDKLPGVRPGSWLSPQTLELDEVGPQKFTTKCRNSVVACGVGLMFVPVGAGKFVGD